MPQNRFWNLLSKKLAGDALPEELSELEQLLKEYPELVYSAEQISHLWQQEQQHTHSYDAELAFQQHLNSLSQQGIYLPELETPLSMYSIPQKAKSGKRKWLIAITSTLLLVSALFLLQFLNTRQPATLIQQKKFIGEVSTRMGDRIQMVLPDSTVVWLNAGSKLTYNEQFGITNRKTTLSGEAYFDVKKGNLPFLIQANQVQIKVLGTAFNVKSYPNDKTTETSLVRGEVEITMDRRPGEKFILKPNEKLIVTNETNTTASSVSHKNYPIVVLSSLTQLEDNTIIETSWVENKLVFQDESFEELAVKMERWYGVEISFSSEKTAGERLSGTFTRESIQEALEILQMTTRFNFTNKSNTIIITE
ncbi:MAG: FecR family protein [Flavisolibacter sp.]